jgi:hypothetical protein
VRARSGFLIGFFFFQLLLLPWSGFGDDDFKLSLSSSSFEEGFHCVRACKSQNNLTANKQHEQKKKKEIELSTYLA